MKVLHGGPAALPHLSESEARVLGFALRTLKAARLRGVSPILYRAALRTSSVRTGASIIEYRRAS